MRMSGLSSISKKLFCVLLLCGLFLFYISVSVRQTTVDMTLMQSETTPRGGMRTVPRKQMEPKPLVQDNTFQRGQDSTMPLEQINSLPQEQINTIPKGQSNKLSQKEYNTFSHGLVNTLAEEADWLSAEPGEPSSRKQISTPSQIHIDTPSQRQIDTPSQRQPDTLSQRQMYTFSESDIDTLSKIIMGVSLQKQMDNPFQRLKDTTPQRQSDTPSQTRLAKSPQGQVDTQSQRLLGMLAQRQMDMSPKKQMVTLTQKQVDPSPQGQVDLSPQREVDKLPKRQMENCTRLNTTPRWCTAVTPEDILQIKLPPFLKEYKNPCWRVQLTGDGAPPIRCLPYFFLAGVPKSGTSDLYARLIQHPQISSMTKKEIHWFTRRRYAPKDKEGVAQYPMFSNYTDFLIPADKDLIASVDGTGYHDKIFGDSSVSTLWDNTGAFRLSTETNTKVPSTAECIHHLNPRTKFISTIRNPVERAYSDYLYFGNYEKSQALFHEGVVKNIKFTTSCLKQHSLYSCIDYESNVRLYIGFYSFHFREFFKYFSKDQFIILKLEDYSSHMPNSLAKIFDFLGLEPLSSQAMTRASDQSTIVNTRPASGVKLGDMWPETRQLLTDFFRPFNEELGKLLGQYYNYNQT